jgi:hypothetical protein
MITRLTSPEVEFKAYLRAYVAYDPLASEDRWLTGFAIEAVPFESRIEHWYRFRCGGCAHVDSQGNGQWFSELPPGINKEEVIDVIPRAGVPSLIEQMDAIAKQIDGSRIGSPNSYGAVVSNLVQLQGGRPPMRVLANLIEGDDMVRLGDPFCVARLLKKCADAVEPAIIRGQLSGREAAAILLLDRLTQILHSGRASSILTDEEILAFLGSLFVHGRSSLEEIAARFLAKWLVMGIVDEAADTLDSLRREADRRITIARQGKYNGLDDVPAYYDRLFSAAPYILAAEVGFFLLASSSEMDVQNRQHFAQMATDLDEKVVRVLYALDYAARDVYGSRYAQFAMVINSLVAKGQVEEANSLILEYVDLNLFYPRSIISNPMTMPSAGMFVL